MCVSVGQRGTGGGRVYREGEMGTLDGTYARTLDASLMRHSHILTSSAAPSSAVLARATSDRKKMH